MLRVSPDPGGPRADTVPHNPCRVKVSDRFVHFLAHFGLAIAYFQPCPRMLRCHPCPTRHGWTLCTDTPPSRQALCCTWPSRAGPAGRPASASLRRRAAPRPGNVPPGSRPAPLRSAPGAGPGPGRALRSAARPMAAPGPSLLYEPAAGPIRAWSALSRDPRFARRARGPRGARCDAAAGLVVTVTAWEAQGGRDLRSPPASTRFESRECSQWFASRECSRRQHHQGDCQTVCSCNHFVILGS